jgi:HlyD family secretion protein
MKRLVPLLVVAVAAALFWFRERWLPSAAGHAAYLGYAEGEAVLLGPAVPGRIVSVAAVKGQMVQQGALLFQLDDAAARSEITRQEAVAATARATAENMTTGRRAEELTLFTRQQAEAEANLTLAKLDFARASNLNQRGVTAESNYDKAKAALAVAEERVQQVKANLVIAQLPARPAEIAAAQSRVSEAEAAIASAKARLADYQATAPASARVDDVFFDAGEVVSAGQPVVSLLLPGKTTLRFYVPEGDRSKAQPGTLVTYSCDGCAGGSATITHSATVPEYTPPVIYSQTARSKLVFLVEAVPATPDPHLQPGLPIEVEPLP